MRKGHIRGSITWPWMIGTAVVVMVVALLIATATRHGQPVRVPLAAPRAASTAPVEHTTSSVAPAVERYLDFAAATQERLHQSNRSGELAKQGGVAVAPVMTVGHDYTAEGLRRLADALAAVQGHSATQVAQSLRADAEELQKNPKSLRHADIVLHAFDQVADAVGGSVPDEGRRLQALASALDATRPLLSQQDTVQAFFVAAADAVRDMTLPS